MYVGARGRHRLGGNSLIDLVVFGRAAAHRASEIVTPPPRSVALGKDAGDVALERLDRTRHAAGSQSTGEIASTCSAPCSATPAVFRTGEVLEEGTRKLDEVASSLGELRLTDRSMIWNSDLVEALELQNLMLQAVATMHSALWRTESRGACPRGLSRARRRNWLRHTLCWVDERHHARLGDRPVHCVRSPTRRNPSAAEACTEGMTASR